jgi:PAS domain-containing protein
MQCNRQTTDRQRGEQALRDHEAGLRRAQQMAKLAHVITGAAGEFLTWSETLPTMIGRDAAAMPGSTRAWLELLHPEDRERVRRIMIQAAKTGTAAVLLRRSVASDIQVTERRFSNASEMSATSSVKIESR